MTLTSDIVFARLTSLKSELGAKALLTTAEYTQLGQLIYAFTTDVMWDKEATEEQVQWGLEKGVV